MGFDHRKMNTLYLTILIDVFNIAQHNKAFNIQILSQGSHLSNHFFDHSCRTASSNKANVQILHATGAGISFRILPILIGRYVNALNKKKGIRYFNASLVP